MKKKEKINLDSIWHAHSEPQRELYAKAEHLRILFRHSTFLLLGNLAGSVTMAVGLWSTVWHGLLLTWLSVMILFNVARWFVGQRLPINFVSEVEVKHWDRRFLASVAISGILWGTAGGLFYVPDQLEHSLFLALLILGMTAAAAASLSFHRMAYPLFLVPAISPITLHLMVDNNLLANAVGFVLPFYFILLYLLSVEIYKTAHESIIGRINSQHLAMLDHLTGVANRRAFEEMMEREWYRAMRDKRVLSLVITDVDNFKLCNDTYGHKAGDQVLKAVATLLENRIRRGADLVARIGGEEFAIVLPNTDLLGAIALAENIRDGVLKLANDYRGEIPSVTMSFGVSSLVPDLQLNPELLFTRADAALYQAKQGGKNRVEYLNAA